MGRYNATYWNMHSINPASPNIQVSESPNINPHCITSLLKTYNIDSIAQQNSFYYLFNDLLQNMGICFAAGISDSNWQVKVT